MNETTKPMAAGRAVRVQHLTSVHPWSDVRIFQKECRSLYEAGFEVGLIAVGAADAVVDGVQVTAIPAPTSRWARVILTGPILFNRARKIDADIFHFHDPELVPVGILLKLIGRKVVYDVHEDLTLQVLTKSYIPRLFRRPLSAAFGVMNRLAERAFDGVVVVTPTIAALFRSPTLVRNYPVHTEFSAEGTLYRDRSPHIAYVGALGPTRGLDRMLEAAARLRQRHEHSLLVLAGPTESEAVVRELNALGDRSGSTYIGVVDRARVAKVLADSRVGLVVLPAETPSYIDAYPTKLFEYMAAGLPVVASDFPVYRTVVAGADCGLLVDPSDVEAIVDAIVWLLDHPEDAAEMGRRGRVAAQSDYNWQTEAANLIELYESIVGERSALVRHAT